MPTTVTSCAFSLMALALLAGSARAQSADTSGSMSAELQSQASAPTSKTRIKRPSTHAPSASMNTTGAGPTVAPTGPYTSTDSTGETSDLSGTTGASIPQPAAPAPPGVAPPGGAPDTGGGEAAPNVDGGPHARR